MSSPNLIVDIPTSILLDIWSNWLGGAEVYRRRLTMRLDSALCNKQARSTLFDLYQHISWETFLVERDCYSIARVRRKMKWTIGRVKLSALELKDFPNDPVVMKSFFRWNAQSLKVLKLTDSTGAMTSLTKAIATECKVLEVLCLERCNVTVPIASILNQTTTITEVRLQSRVRRYGAQKSVLPLPLLARIRCTSVTKLTLLDEIPLGSADIIQAAFPNAVDLELCNPEPAVLQTLLNEEKVNTLRLVNSPYGGEIALLEAIAARNRESLCALIITSVNLMHATSLQRVFAACANLSSLTVLFFWCSEK